MRLFIAIDAESGEVNKIKKEFDLPGLKLTNNNHVTLKFLGEVDEKTLEEVKIRLKKIKFKQFNIRISGAGCFPNENYVKVVWVGIESDDLAALQKDIHKSLADIFPDEREFVPHLTLARVKFVKDEILLKEKLKTKFSEETVRINNFKLIKSELQKNGPVYTVLETYNAE